MASSANSSKDNDSNKPTVIITIGMAGSGKTTFVQRINSYLNSKNPERSPYMVNLDPAVSYMPFDANIDIRDTVNYKEVMKQLSDSQSHHFLYLRVLQVQFRSSGVLTQ